MGRSNLAWSVSVLEWHHAPWLDSIAAAAIPTLTQQYKAQACGNLAWAVASLLLPHNPLLNAIAAQAIRRRSDFSSRRLDTTAWAVSLLGFKPLEGVWQLVGQSGPMLPRAGQADW